MRGLYWRVIYFLLEQDEVETPLRLRKMIFQSVKQAARKKNPSAPDRSPIHNLLATVVQKVDSAIQWKNHYPMDNSSQLVSLIIIHWMAIYPEDSAIQLLNWGLVTSADALLLSYRRLIGAETGPFSFLPVPPVSLTEKSSFSCIHYGGYFVV